MTDMIGFVGFQYFIGSVKFFMSQQDSGVVGKSAHTGLDVFPLPLLQINEVAMKYWFDPRVITLRGHESSCCLS